MRQNRDGEQKLFRLFGHFSIIFLLSTSLLSAKTFEEFKRSQTQSFEKYKDERDNRFNKYLKEQWKSYNAYKGTPIYEKLKPKEIVLTKVKEIDSVGPKVSIEVKKVEYIEPKQIQRDLSVLKDIDFDFFGSDLGFEIPQGLKKAKFYPQNQKGISNFFTTAASSEYESLITNIKRVSSTMNLNDWGVYLLVLKLSNQVHPNPDNSNLLSWFIFSKLGYAVKVGLAQRHIVLMHYSQKIIYATPSYIFSGKKFYVVSKYAKGSIDRLYSYKQNYPDADKPLDLSLNTIPNFISNMKSKSISFDEYGTTYKLSYEYNQNLIDFMATYPQADYETYFNAPLDSRTYESIASDIKKYVDGMKTGDAINFVLHFVQKAFKYEVDREQFSREKVMFATETLFYEKSDCEDRAVLFAYLIRELFGIGVVGVKYDNHMTTALYIPIVGDSVKVGKRTFIIADPTYVNANIGQSMPAYRSIKPDSFVVWHLKKDKI